MGLQRVGHDWVTSLSSLATSEHSASRPFITLHIWLTHPSQASPSFSSPSNPSPLLFCSSCPLAPSWIVSLYAEAGWHDQPHSQEHAEHPHSLSLSHSSIFLFRKAHCLLSPIYLIDGWALLRKLQAQKNHFKGTLSPFYFVTHATSQASQISKMDHLFHSPGSLPNFFCSDSHTLFWCLLIKLRSTVSHTRYVPDKTDVN